MSNNFIRDFKKFQSRKRNDVSEKVVNKLTKTKETKVEESVVVRDSKYVVGGVVVEQSFINSYIKKVKDQTGKTLRQMYSDQDIAEELVKYLVDTHGDVENIPVSALLGGEEGMEEEVDDIDMETPAEVDDDTITDEPVEEPVEEPAEIEPSSEEGSEAAFAEDGEDFESAFEEGSDGEGAEAEAEGEGVEDFDAGVGEEGEGDEAVDLFADESESDESEGDDDDENLFDESGETKDDEDEDELPL